MNDKIKSKVDTKIEVEELKDEELGDEALENVDGGPTTYVKFEGVKGESQDSNHDQWINLQSVNYVVHKPRR